MFGLGIKMILQITIIALVAIFWVGCDKNPNLAEILQVEYESKMISSGKNRPQINLRKDQLRELIILLHHRVPLSDVQSFFSWDDEDLDKRLNLLIENDFVEYHDSGIYLPTTMVITKKEGEILLQLAGSVAQPVSDIIANRLPEIKKHYYKLKCFEGISFESASFFIVSNVILDNWQINNIERLPTGYRTVHTKTGGGGHRPPTGRALQPR